MRSASHTAWWRTDDLDVARKVLASHGERLDYIYDTVTGGRPG